MPALSHTDAPQESLYFLRDCRDAGDRRVRVCTDQILPEESGAGVALLRSGRRLRRMFARGTRAARIINQPL